MMGNEVLPYNPVVLKWARETSGYSVEDIASKFNKTPDVIRQWESGENSPTYVQLERLAYELYKRPIAIFFFPEPPQESSPKESFRTLPEHEIEQMSPKFKFILRKAHAMQENLRELNEGKNPAKQNILENFFIDAQASIDDVAIALRKYLSVSLETQKSWKNDDIALKYWRGLLEDQGLFIFKDAFREDAFSGFCIYDSVFPIIYLNNSKSKTRQIFTLFHELAHILFKTGGVDTRLDDYIDYLDEDSKKIEVYCNKFASSFLVPESDFVVQISGKAPVERTFATLANQYNVSREVILRKCLDIGMVDRSFYLEKSQEWTEQARKAKEAKQKEKSTGHFFNTKSAYLGQHFMGLVFTKFYQKKISPEQVADYFGIKSNQISKLESIYLNGTGA